VASENMHQQEVSFFFLISRGKDEFDG